MNEPHDRAAAPPRLVTELTWYYALVALYFFAFGIQVVLFPSLVAFILGEPPARVGFAQMAISAPMFCFLLMGGVLAERAQPGPTLAVLQAAFAVASLVLCALITAGWLTYPVLLCYAVAAGAFAAFVMPLRDAALNGVVAREAARGRITPIARAATTTTAVQIGAQIAGILVAQFAGATPAPYLAGQALVLGAAAGVALFLRAPKPVGHERTLSSALRDVREGLAYAFRNPVMSPMLISAAYVGVFMIGSFQVLFPLIIRDSYGGDPTTQAGRLSALFAAFWGASFISAALLSRLPPLSKPGRALILSHLAGAVALGSFAIHKPFTAFAVIVAAWGLAAGVAISMSRTIVQGAAAPQYLGRVLAVYSMGFMGGAPIGSILAGVAAEHLGARTAALIPAVGLLVAALTLAATTPLWRLQVDHER